MKKISLLLIFVVILACSAYAQGVSGGLKAGLNVANQKFTNIPGVNTDARVGYHVGGFLSCMFSEAFGVQPELLFNSVGSKINSGGTSIALRYSYLTLPVMFRYNPIPILNIHAGPQVAALLSAKQVQGSNSETIPNTKPVEFSVAVGAGLDLPMGFVAAVRYNVGLSDISDDNSSSTQINNNYLQLSVGYKFFGKK
jgi:hypothetical protein